MKSKNNQYIINQQFDVLSLNYDNLKIDFDAIHYLSRAYDFNFFYYDFYKNNLYYINPQNNYFSVSPKTENNLIFYFDTILDEEIKYVNNLHERAFKYISGLEYQKAKDVILNYKCHLKNKNENYEMYDVKLVFIEFDSCNKIWIVLFLFQISTINDFFIPYLLTSKNEKFTYNLNPEKLKLLTESEIKVAHLLWNNLSNKDISDTLLVSQDTIRYHIKNINRKIGVENRFDLQKTLIYK